jgi:hypothetical protein
MAGDKYLYDNAGQITEKAAIQSSAGAGDAGKIPAVDSTGRLDSSFMPVGTAPEVISVVASEALSAGNFVNIWNNAGTLNVRKADATAVGKEANGFVLAAVSSSATATVFSASNMNTQLTGLTVGAVYYLDTTAGGVTTTAPSATGNLVQRLGRANSTTALVFQPGETWVKA